MYLECNICGGNTWVDDPPAAVDRIDVDCPCGADFILYCEGGEVQRSIGCTVKDAKDLS